jgi:phosphoadenosine phosphosulfate reductase
MNLFNEEIEQQAIERIQKFAKIARAMGFEVCLGFSGGKDSQVCYDLCKRSGIAFKAYFNRCFESNITIRFIRENYPDVIFRKNVKEGFIRNIRVNHKGLLPTVQSAYCCVDYKHNPKSVDYCSIVGVRKAESAKRRERTAFGAKNKTVMKQNKALFNDYFEDRCQSIGTPGIIQLKPIID